MSLPAWRDHAACDADGVETEWFFPNERDTGSNFVDPRAAALCATCPVLWDCRAYALAYERDGYWGGMSARARDRARRRAGIKLQTGGPDEAAEWRRKRAIDLWTRDWPVRHIAAELGAEERTIHRWLGAAGFDSTPPRPGSAPRRTRPNRMSIERTTA